MLFFSKASSLFLSRSGQLQIFQIVSVRSKIWSKHHFSILIESELLMKVCLLCCCFYLILLCFNNISFFTEFYARFIRRLNFFILYFVYETSFWKQSFKTSACTGRQFCLLFSVTISSSKHNRFNVILLENDPSKTF